MHTKASNRGSSIIRVGRGDRDAIAIHIVG